MAPSVQNSDDTIAVQIEPHRNLDAESAQTPA
jgi:hypothetical protein